ncbi:MAG: hypothetical protein R3326_05990 [Gemmatimonadota bacterium]|nr:hypothetical protein [Gemmatimonadota bacterium]
MATIPVDDPEVWSQRAELAVGERAVFDAGAIEIVLTEAGDSHALVTIDKQGVTSEGRLTTDPRGFVAVPPYQIRLVAADADETAIIEVTRPR